jgi:flagellar basal-body rod protein FlgB
VAFEGIGSVRLLEDALRVSVLNHTVLANNIANADTPGFTPSRLDFQATLRESLEGRGRVSLRKTQARHLEVSRSIPRFNRLALLSKNDYNKVDLEQEMADLAENTGRYTIYSSLLAKQFKQVKDMLTALR